MQQTNSSAVLNAHAIPQLTELPKEREVKQSAMPLGAIWVVVALLALGVGGYFVVRAQSINASAHAELEILRMTAAHNAEMFAFREHLQKVDAQIAAARASTAVLKAPAVTTTPGTRLPVRTNTSSPRVNDRRPAAGSEDRHDRALDGLDSADLDPLGGLDVDDAPKPKRKRK